MEVGETKIPTAGTSRSSYQSPWIELHKVRGWLEGDGIELRELLGALQDGALVAEGVYIRASDRWRATGDHRFPFERECEEIKPPTTISREWWMLVGRNVELHEPGLVLTRDVPGGVDFITNIRVRVADIDRLWPLPDSTNAQTVSSPAIEPRAEMIRRARKGRPPSVEFDVFVRALEIECDNRGTIPPDDDGPIGWRIKADVERWATDWFDDRQTSVSESTVRKHVTNALKIIEGRKFEK